MPVALALTASIFIILLLSVMIGTALPLILRQLGFNIEHSGAIIQAIMDILGVCITCVVCSFFLG